MAKILSSEEYKESLEIERGTPMRTVRDNIKSIIETNKIVFNTKMEIEFLINNRGVEGLSNEEYKKIGDLLDKQDIEMTNLRHFVGELIETFVGEGNYKSFMGET